MVVYHVCSLKKFNRYLTSKYIKGPVRAWKNIASAEQFSKQTGRKIILRLKFPKKDINTLKGHKGNAIYIKKNYPFYMWMKENHLYPSLHKV